MVDQRLFWWTFNLLQDRVELISNQYILLDTYVMSSLKANIAFFSLLLPVILTVNEKASNITLDDFGNPLRNVFQECLLAYWAGALDKTINRQTFHTHLPKPLERSLFYVLPGIRCTNHYDLNRLLEKGRVSSAPQNWAAALWFSLPRTLPQREIKSEMLRSK